MRSKVNFGHPKWPTAAILSKIQKKKSCVSIWNGQKCDRKLISDIQNGRRQPFCQKFPKQIKLHIDLKWPEMRSKVNFGHPKWARRPFWMSENNFRSHIWPFQIDTQFCFEIYWQNGRRRPFWMGRQCQLSNSSEIYGWVMHVSSLILFK